MQQWLELYQKPAANSKLISKSISLCKYGPGLMGFATVCHGGAVLTMMDEALAFTAIANDMIAAGKDTTDWASNGDAIRENLEAGKSLAEALKDFRVTAQMDTKFLRPVRCPGVVGIEVTLLETKGHKMKLKGVMKDGKGTPLVVTDGLFIQIRGGAKI
jgi:acyl-coenzyme A thioesterase PaaI-like protein